MPIGESGRGHSEHAQPHAERWRRRTSFVSFWTQSYILRDPHAPPCRACERACARARIATQRGPPPVCASAFGAAQHAQSRRGGTSANSRCVCWVLWVLRTAWARGALGTVGTTVERRGAHSGGIERFCDVFTFGSLSRQCRAWMTKCVTPAHGAGRALACAVQTQPPTQRRPNARASSPADAPYGSAVRRRANVRLDHAAEGNAAEPHRTTRQRRAGRRGRAAQAVPRLAA